jgi:hypothetical protein
LILGLYAYVNRGTLGVGALACCLLFGSQPTQPRRGERSGSSGSLGPFALVRPLWASYRLVPIFNHKRVIITDWGLSPNADRAHVAFVIHCNTRGTP